MKMFLLSLGLLILAGCATTAPYVAKDNSKESIRAAIHSKMDDFKYCYKPVIRRDTAAKGKVILTWSIGESGKVENAKIDPASEIKDADMHACMIKALQDLQFAPSPKEVVTVKFPVEFQNYQY